MKRLFIFLLFFYSINSFSQNYLFDIEESGAHIGIQFERNAYQFLFNNSTFQGGSTSVGLVAGYTIKGRLTAEVTIGLIDYIPFDVILEGFESFAIPRVSYLLLKEGVNNAPVSLGLGLSAFINYSRKYAEPLDIYRVSPELTAYKQLSENENFIFIAGVGGSFDFIDSEVLFAVQTSFLFPRFYITPSIKAGRQNRFFGAQMGFFIK